MREAILLFGAEEKVAIYLRKTLVSLRVMVRSIPQEQYAHSLGWLAGDKSCPTQREPYQGQPLEKPLLLLAGFSPSRMELVLNAMRRGGLYFDYKAMLTPTNISWTFAQLCEELSREHQAVTGGGAAHSGQ